MSFFVNDYSQSESLCVEKWKSYLKGKSKEFFSYKLYNKLSKDFQDSLKCIISLPFKTCGENFYNFLKINNDEIKKEMYFFDQGDYIKPFFLVESYLRDKTPTAFEEIKDYLCQVRSKDFNMEGTEVLRPALADGMIVKNVYRSGDKDLIRLFKQYLPKPDIALFQIDGGPVPEFILEEANQADSTIKCLIRVNGKEKLERCTIFIQRRIRGRQKREKELLRVMKLENIDKNSAKNLILASDRPYMPKCKDSILAKRIFKAAWTVSDHPTINHITAAWALPKILDECLYGRQSLAAHYLSYRPAQLSSFDQTNGDANVICFGPQEIDEEAWKPESVQIVLDMKKFQENPSERLNPCVFFKQQDLGYILDKTRIVMISQDSWISFNHTTRLRCQKNRHVGFTLGPKHAEKYAEVPFQQLISSNFKKMTAIQTLNFFRYLDNLTDSARNKDSYTIDRIYNEIANLDDKELESFLDELHKSATDTAEFNFYGAYRIDLSLIKEIVYAPQGLSAQGRFSVCVSELIDSLNVGDRTVYKKAREIMPFLFESERFMNFLRSSLKNPAILEI